MFLDSLEFKELNKDNFEGLINKVFEIRNSEIENFKKFYTIMDSLNMVFKGTDKYNTSIIYKTKISVENFLLIFLFLS